MATSGTDGAPSPESPALRTALLNALAAAAAFLLWVYPSKAVTDVVVWGAFFWALPRGRRGVSAWASPAGLCALLVFLYPVLLVPCSQDPLASLRDLARDARLPALAFILSVLASDLGGALRALRASALVLLPVMALDLARLVRALGLERLLAEARYFKPYILNHPNVSSMLAGASVLICLHAAWENRRRAWPRALFGLGAALALAYLVVMASRGPQAAFAAASGTALILVPRTWKGRLAGLLAALAAAAVVGTQLDSINARFLDKTDLLSGREVVWRHTVALVARHPWIGHGYGKDVFQAVYAASNPPPSPHFFPHPHQYLLFVLFQGGRAWLVLHAALWLLLAIQLGRALKNAEGERRLGLALLALLLVLWHGYGLGDYPDNRLQIGFVGLFALTLAAVRRPAVKP